jgi:hypothetical protein
MDLTTRIEARAQAAARRSARARVVLSLGPATALAGVLWALLQPYRITLLHPGDGFWWYAVQPPLLVIAAGALFHYVVARGVVEDLEEAGRE